MTALAVDLGASGGKVFAGSFDGERLSVREVHRFRNDPVRAAGHLHWDILRLLHEITQGMRAACNLGSEIGELSSLALDSWGCDFGLLDRNGELAGNPYHYRDGGTPAAMDEVLRKVPATEIFAQTGVQFIAPNTLYQLYALKRRDSTALERAETLLLIPDLLRYLLTGEMSSEYTNATTTQFLNIHTGDWDRDLLRRLDLPDQILAPIVRPAIVAGRLRADVRAETGTAALPVMAVGSHDTASAVAATPAAGRFAYLSSGTWSLLGTELDHPVIEPRALEWNFTNEGGLNGTYRLLKNITGLWLVERCRHAWEREGIWPGYENMTQHILAARPFMAFIDPNDLRFLNPLDMPAAIVNFCRDSGQEIPQTPAEVMRVVLESLAFTYRFVLERTAALSGHNFPGLHVVGGGTQNTLLQQFTADAIGRPVWAGPTEATAIGNVLGQLLAVRRIGSLQEGRDIVRASFPLITYEPANTPAWDDAYARYLAVRTTV
ncbi:MAG: rhamnulokinase family protein [Thermomicrobiales bacterium]